MFCSPLPTPTPPASLLCPEVLMFSCNLKYLSLTTRGHKHNLKKSINVKFASAFFLLQISRQLELATSPSRLHPCKLSRIGWIPSCQSGSFSIFLNIFYLPSMQWPRSLLTDPVKEWHWWKRVLSTLKKKKKCSGGDWFIQKTKTKTNKSSPKYSYTRKKPLPPTSKQFLHLFALSDCKTMSWSVSYR